MARMVFTLDVSALDGMALARLRTVRMSYPLPCFSREGPVRMSYLLPCFSREGPDANSANATGVNATGECDWTVRMSYPLPCFSREGPDANGANAAGSNANATGARPARIRMRMQPVRDRLECECECDRGVIGSRWTGS